MNDVRPSLDDKLTRFFGREHELSRMEDLFETGARLVSVIGLGGIGKTRLARHYAESRGDAEVWLVGLGAAADEQGFAEAVARALGVPPDARQAFDEQLDVFARVLAARGGGIIVLDNAEERPDLVARAATRWLAQAPLLQILVTSRVELGIPGEHLVQLGPLSTQAAQAMFVDRARALREGFTPGVEQDRLDALLERIDRVPLAIELTAGWMDVLSCAELAARIGAGGTGANMLRDDTPGRERSLAAIIAWSLAGLAADERAVLAACATFAGGFTLDLAERIAAPGLVPRALRNLKRRGLVQVLSRAEDGEQRLSVLNLVAAHLEPLDADLFVRHAEVVTEVGEALMTSSSSVGDRDARARLGALASDLLAAARRVRVTHPVLAARALLAIEPLVGREVHIRHFLDLAAVAPHDNALPATLAARLTCARARQHIALAQLDDAERDLARALKDPTTEREALQWLVMLRVQQGRRDEAAALYEQALAAFDRAGDATGRVHFRAEVLLSVFPDRLADIQAATGEGLAAARRDGDERRQARYLWHLGAAEYERGAFAVAERAFAEGSTLAEAWGDLRLACIFSRNLGLLRFERGDAEAGWSLLQRSIAAATAGGQRLSEAYTRLSMGILAHIEGRLDAALVHHRSALALFAGLPGDWAAALHAELGDLQEARRQLESAVRQRTASEERIREGLRAFVDLALARAAPSQSAAHREQARARLERLRGGPRDDDVASAPVAHVEIRLAIALLEAALARAEPTTAPDTMGPPDLPIPRRTAVQLTIGPSARWYHVRDDEPVDLSRRRILRALLDALSEKRRAAPGVSTSANDLLEVLWPGQSSIACSLYNRLYASVHRLRDLGLVDILSNQDDGYLLNPEVAVTWVDVD